MSAIASNMSYRQCQFSKAERMPNSINLFQANYCFYIKPSIFAESYMKLDYFVTILAPVTLQGSVSDEVGTVVLAHTVSIYCCSYMPSLT